MNATGGGDAGSGGCASVFAGTRVQMLGPGGPERHGLADAVRRRLRRLHRHRVALRRHDDQLPHHRPRAARRTAAAAGSASSPAARSAWRSAAPLSVQGQGPQSCGGEIALEADLDVFASGDHGRLGRLRRQPDRRASPGRNVTVNGMVDAAGTGRRQLRRLGHRHLRATAARGTSPSTAWSTSRGGGCGRSTAAASAASPRSRAATSRSASSREPARARRRRRRQPRGGARAAHHSERRRHRRDDDGRHARTAPTPSSIRAACRRRTTAR